MKNTYVMPHAELLLLCREDVMTASQGQLNAEDAGMGKVIDFVDDFMNA